MTLAQNTPFITRAKRLTEREIRGLRVTPEYFTQKERYRKTLFPDGFFEENTGPEGLDGILTVTKLQQNINPFQSSSVSKLKSKKNIWELNDTRPASTTDAEILFQDDPKDECLYTKHTGIRRYSFTDSRETRSNCAWKELMILLQKGRIPMFEVRVNFFSQFQTKKDIDQLRASISRCLKYRKIDAVASIELTTGKDGKPNNTVHFHYLMGDKENDEHLPREEEKKRRKEIAGFMQKVCERSGFILNKDFKVESRPLWNGGKYFAYFVKHGKYGKCIPLFIEGLRMQEFTQTGWFEKGEKKQLFDEYLKERYGEKYSRKAKK